MKILLNTTEIIKKDYKKRLVKDNNFFRNKKCNIMGLKDIKISLKMKNKSWLSIKKYLKMRKNTSL